MLPNGAVVVSLDFELAWGAHGLDVTHDLDGDRQREIVSRLLDVFDEFEAPATWATVGHLMLDACDGVHADMPRPSGALGERWYDADPESTADDASLFYAPDLVEAIFSADVDHELGTHTFSHLPCESADADALERELDRCRSLTDEFGSELHSLVFPLNEVAHLDTVSDAGIRVFRDVGRESVLRHDRLAGRYRKYGRFLTRRPIAPVEPETVVDGLWRLPASMYLPYDPLSPAVNDLFPTHPRVVRAVKSIRAAKRDGEIFHLWAHPRNFDERLFRDLRAILAGARELDVPVLTMDGAVTEFVEA